jgi:hypothetical protein
MGDRTTSAGTIDSDFVTLAGDIVTWRAQGGSPRLIAVNIMHRLAEIDDGIGREIYRLVGHSNLVGAGGSLVSRDPGAQ